MSALKSSPAPKSLLAVPGKILVVDDNLRNLQAIVNCLHLESFEVWGVSCGEEALEILRHKSPELILLDVVMPGVNGFELCRLIKDNPLWEGIPILFLSGELHQGSITKGFELGAVDYIAKPFQRAELVARVRTHIELTRRRAQAHYHVDRQAALLKASMDAWQQPLRAIQLLTESLPTKAPAELENVAIQIARESKNLLQQHETFVADMERLWGEANMELHHRAYGIEDLKQLVGQWYVSAKRKNIALKIQAPNKNVWLKGGSYCIGQIMEAIVSNAVACTPSHGQIHVNLRQVANLVEVTVYNSGNGFPEDYLKQPFVPYLKGSNPESNKLGLGLASAKKAAERIGAVIKLENPPQGGACVTLHLQTDEREELKDLS